MNRLLAAEQPVASQQVITSKQVRKIISVDVCFGRDEVTTIGKMLRYRGMGGIRGEGHLTCQ